MEKRFYIYRLLIIFVGIMSFGTVWSQQTKVANLISFDEKPYHFGFFFGTNQMLFSLKTNANFDVLKPFDGANSYEIPNFNGDTIQIKNIGASTSLRFNVGIVSDLRLGNYMNLRFTPTLLFGDLSIQYDIDYYLSSVKYDSVLKIKNFSPVMLNFPLTLKIKGARMHNARPYILIGGSLGIDVGNNKGVIDEKDGTPLKLKRTNYFAEVGVGFDFYFNWFKMSTELKMAYGIKNDMLQHESNIWTDPIERLNSKLFQFNITFE